jgi:hypothetical protein
MKLKEKRKRLSRRTNRKEAQIKSIQKIESKDFKVLKHYGQKRKKYETKPLKY